MQNWSQMVTPYESGYLEETVDGGGGHVLPGELVHDQRQDWVRVARGSLLHG